VKKLPNALSLFRLILAPVVPVAYSKGNTEVSSIIFFILALSDALDGFLARLLNAHTLLGKFLDPLADKVLLLCGLYTLSFLSSKVQPIVMFLLLSRDIFLILGTLLLQRFGFVPEPSLLGKLTTLFLSLLVIDGFLTELIESKIFSALIPLLSLLSAVLILLSWLDYTLRGVNFLKARLIMERR